MREQITALVVDDERNEYVEENLGTVLESLWEMDVSFEYVSRVEEALKRLPRGQARYRLVLCDMLFPPAGEDGAPRQRYDARGLEVIRRAKETPGVVVVGISEGSTVLFPQLREDAIEAGADVFRFRSEMLGRKGLGWRNLADEVYVALSGRRSGMPTSATTPDSRLVFLIHGRDLKAAARMQTILGALGLTVLEFEAARALTRKPSPYIGEILDAGLAAAQAVVVLMTGDDEGRVCPEFREPGEGEGLTRQARQNVIFEAGMAMGLKDDRTVLVEVGDLRPFSDISGRHVIRLDDTSEKRHQLAERLRSAGCDVRTEGMAWLRAGLERDA